MQRVVKIPLDLGLLLYKILIYGERKAYSRYQYLYQS